MECRRSKRGAKSYHCLIDRRISLLSTNFIENSFRNVRAKTGRVKRWRTETAQAERWLAYGLLEAERGFRRMKGWKDIPKLVEKLKKPDRQAQKRAA